MCVSEKGIKQFAYSISLQAPCPQGTHLQTSLTEKAEPVDVSCCLLGYYHVIPREKLFEPPQLAHEIFHSLSHKYVVKDMLCMQRIQSHLFKATGNSWWQKEILFDSGSLYVCACYFDHLSFCLFFCGFFFGGGGLRDGVFLAVMKSISPTSGEAWEAVQNQVLNPGHSACQSYSLVL